MAPSVARWFFGQVVGAAEDAFRRAGYTLMLYLVEDQERRISRIVTLEPPVLVVNVASKCGLTPQYAALENLYSTPEGLEQLLADITNVQ
mgnify:CR=1 FL=1